MKLTPEAQCAANVRAWLTKYALGGPVEFTRVESDRVWLLRDPALETAFSAMCERGLIEKRFAGNHGKGIVVAYREDVPRCAAQVIVHPESIEIDFDYFQPRDVVGGAGHLWEILINLVRKKKTDPFRIAEMLRKRGIHGDITA